MIFAAGLGTRLKPLTQHTPKALIKVGNQELLAYNILRLKSAGITQVVINVHYFAQQIVDFLKANKNFGIDIKISDESDLLLDTGGGLKKAQKYLTGADHILLQNVDIYSNLNYNQLLKAHLNSKAMATLAVRNRESSRYLWFNPDKQLVGWEHTKTGKQLIITQSDSINKLAFSGIHIIRKEVLNTLPDKNIFSIIEVYLKLAKTDKIEAFVHDNDYWFDIGSVDKLHAAKTFIQNNL